MSVGKTDSSTNYSYVTFKVTKSRIDKGLLAIPKSLAYEYFPDHNSVIQISSVESDRFETKSYTSFKSSSKEARIGGMRAWYYRNKISDGDEIVIQVIDKENLKYKILPERQFLNKIQQLQEGFDKAVDEVDATNCLSVISSITGVDKNQAAFHEALRLVQATVRARKYSPENVRKSKEKIPASLKSLLGEIYQGHCQLTDFSFIMKNGKPYFEVHHINPNVSNHIKNLLVVCPNIHAQFTYANVYLKFDNEGWLHKVKLNETEFTVIQKIRDYYKKTKFDKHVYS
jgi:hypothetical protein